MTQTDRPVPELTTTRPKPGAMSVHTFFWLNGGVLLMVAALCGCIVVADSSNIWAFVLWVGVLLLAAVVANGFLFCKALWRREYLLSLGYLAVVVGAVMVFATLPAPGKIGG